LSRTSNALNAPVSSEQIRFKQTSETLCTNGQVPDEIPERVPDCGVSDTETENCPCGSRRLLFTEHWMWPKYVQWFSTAAI